MSDHDLTMGPGTDLVVSLLAVTLLLIGMLMNLYSDSVAQGEEGRKRNEELIAKIEKFKEGDNAGQPDYVATREALDQARREKAGLADELSATRADRDFWRGRHEVLQREHEIVRQRADQDIAEVRAEARAFFERFQAVQRELDELRHVQAKQEQDSEEVIRFTDSDGNTFDTGSFELSDTYMRGIEDRVLPRIKRLVASHGVGRVIVEVFGFTDGEPVPKKRACTMDQHLIGFNWGGGEIPQHCSNTDLAKLRADAVGRYIRDVLGQEGLRGVRVLGYSAGQTIGPNDTLQVHDDFDANRARRFVDVRFRIAWGNEAAPARASTESMQKAGAGS
jgi:outer membrane protein OmpA-like peptidoglycan-associated protein